VGSIAAGRAPEGLALDESERLAIASAADRTLTIVDASEILSGADTTATELARVALVAREPLSPAVLRGKRIFHDASDKRMSKEGYISCASCHLEGDQDGRNWDFSDRGQGIRNTISMLGRAGMGHGRVHWTANFDEIQDFESDMLKEWYFVAKDADEARTRKSHAETRGPVVERAIGEAERLAIGGARPPHRTGVRRRPQLAVAVLGPPAVDDAVADGAGVLSAPRELAGEGRLHVEAGV
jgi:hypothetical protein